MKKLLVTPYNKVKKKTSRTEIIPVKPSKSPGTNIYGGSKNDWKYQYDES